MLALGLRISLLLELAILAAIGAALLHTQRPAWMVIALLVAVFLVWRLIFIVASFLVAAPGPRKVGLGYWCRAVFAEYLLMLRLYLWHHVFPPGCQAREGDNVLLVHGYLCNSGTWAALRVRLEAAGFQVRCVELDPRYHDIEHCLRTLDRALADISAPVWMIGHSMGGLISRYYANDTWRALRGVIALGAPFRGTRLAGVLGGSEAGPPWPGCRWLALLNARIAQKPAPVPLLSLYSDMDNIVSPQESSVVADARCELIPGVGHLGLAWDERVAQRCIAWMREAAESSLPSGHRRPEAATAILEHQSEEGTNHGR